MEINPHGARRGRAAVLGERTAMSAPASAPPDGRTALVVGPAVAEDAAQIAVIWNREVLESATTTETEPRTSAAQRAWLTERSDAHPVVVVRAGAEVAAFGALSSYRERAAFRATVEDSVYVKLGWRGQGLGGLLLGELVRLAVGLGHHSIIARITAGNAASLRLHRRHGFARIGREREVAFKLDAWLDVIVMQHVLAPR